MSVREPTPWNAGEGPNLTSTNPYSLHKALHARRDEYTKPHRLRIKIGTWNVAACPGTEKDLARWFVEGEALNSAPESSKQRASFSGHPLASGVEHDNGPILLTKDGRIGLYVLGLQEVNMLSSPSQYMTWIYAPDTAASDKWKAALEAALPAGYQLVAAEQLAGMLLLAYASPEVAPTISHTSICCVGTGALGYLGNKGAVCLRIILGETTRLLFVNCHLASGVGDAYAERRIYQVRQILSQACFDSPSLHGIMEESKEKIGAEDFAFWFGDFNSRLDRLPGDDIRHLLMLHTKGEYDVSKQVLSQGETLGEEALGMQQPPASGTETSDKATVDAELRIRSEDKGEETSNCDDDSLLPSDSDEFSLDPHQDPGSLQSTLDSLLPHDQLLRLMKERKAFHEGWREGPIRFLPTYKYDIGTVTSFDSSEKRRPPGWCDRILYRSRMDLERYERKVREEEALRKREEEMKARGILEDIDDQVLFAYDPENDGDDQPETAKIDYDEFNETGEGHDYETMEVEDKDKIWLELYTSHQLITSSDHKPVSSIFTIEYNAVVPSLKAKVHAEVARELDRAENEGRPIITVVVDQHDVHQNDKGRRSAESEQVDFGEMVFLRKKAASLIIANTGRVPATFSFVRPAVEGLEDNTTLHSWLSTSFVRYEPPDQDFASVKLGTEVTLEPGETINALLEALVNDVNLARSLNQGQALDEVLILSVKNGRDHFIPVRASWAPSCIGWSIPELIRVPDGGIRGFAKSRLLDQTEARNLDSDLPVHRPAPKELLHLIEALEILTQRATAEAQMIEDLTIPHDPGWPFDEATCTSIDRVTRLSLVASVLDALDQDQPLLQSFPPQVSVLARLEVVSHTLILFLSSLTDGIVPTHIWNIFVENQTLLEKITTAYNSITTGSLASANAACAAAQDAILDILIQASPHHNISFVFLTATLSRVVAELSPMTKTQWDLLMQQQPAQQHKLSGRTIGSSIGGVFGRRAVSASYSFTTDGSSNAAPHKNAPDAATVSRRATNLDEATSALAQRRAREKRVADLFAPLICHGLEGTIQSKESKAAEKMRAILGLFLRERLD